MSFEIGSRVRDADGFRGTVRYVGPVAAAKNKVEPWLGVEWDDATRGKHDGSCVDDKGDFFRYFKCKMGAGSFVKHGKIIGGVSLVEALQRRYVSFDAPEITEADSSLPGAFVTTSKGHVKKIELLGEKKLRKWQQLHAIDKIAVRNDNVSVVGEGLDTFASHLIEVDLQDNLLWSWREVFVLGERLPSLQNLLLHGNKMQPLDSNIAATLPITAFRSLRLLALNACSITSWASIQLLDPLLPALEELYLSENQLLDLPRDEEEASRIAALGLGPCPSAASAADGVDVPPPPPPALALALAPEGTASEPPIVSGFTHLRLLDITRCGLDEWSQVRAFARLPSLQQLILDGNNLSSIGSVLPGEFLQVQRLSLSSTQLASWTDINALAAFPALRQLRLSHIPLFAGKGASEVRPLIIGRLSQLAVFNASIVSVRERRDSEKSYLRDILRAVALEQKQLTEAAAATASVTATATAAAGVTTPPVATDLLSVAISPAILSLHPRFQELRQLYAADLSALQGASGGETGSMASDLLNISLLYMSISSVSSAAECGVPVVKRLPASLTVTRLRSMVKQLFGLDPHLQQLSIRHYKDSVPSVMDDDSASLQYYGADNGSEIFINEAKGTA